MATRRNVRVTHEIAAQFLANAVASVGGKIGATQPQTWWPGPQRDRSVLAQAIAMEWANYGTLGTAQSPIWVSTCYAKNTPLQRDVLQHGYGVSFPPNHLRYAPNGNRRFDAEQYLVDFSLWEVIPRDEDAENLLIMESEMYSQSGVGAEVVRTNGYAYDFFKVVWLPGPRRLFVCSVANEHRRDRLQKSLCQVAAGNPSLIGEDELILLILPSSRNLRNDYRIGIWAPVQGDIDWQTAPVVIP